MKKKTKSERSLPLMLFFLASTPMTIHEEEPHVKRKITDHKTNDGSPGKVAT